MAEPGVYNPTFTRGDDWSDSVTFYDFSSTQGHRLLQPPMLPDGNPLTGPPAAGLGGEGDYYFDPIAEWLYGPKTSGVWGAGAPAPRINYAGFTFASQLREFEDATDAIDLTIDSSMLNIGELVMSIPNPDTQTLQRKYAWDLQYTSPGGLVTTYLHGVATVILDVTRP